MLTCQSSAQQTGSRTGWWWNLHKRGVLGSAGWPARARLHSLPRCHQRYECWELTHSFHNLRARERRIDILSLFANWFRSQAGDYSQPTTDAADCKDLNLDAGGLWVHVTYRYIEVGRLFLSTSRCKWKSDENTYFWELYLIKAAAQECKLHTCMTDVHVCPGVSAFQN